MCQYFCYIPIAFNSCVDSHYISKIKLSFQFFKKKYLCQSVFVCDEDKTEMLLHVITGNLLIFNNENNYSSA